MKFPGKIFVTVENEGNKEDEFFIVNRSIEEAPDLWPKGKVAIYELKEVQEIIWEYTTRPFKEKYSLK